jgi:hypothetical protein
MQPAQPDHVTAGKCFPLRLCEVLEREFIVTHGPLRSQRNWLLEAGDISLAALIDQLRGTVESAPSTPHSAIGEKLRGKGFIIPDGHRFADDTGQRLVELLNSALQTPEYLYDPQLLEPDTEAARWAEIWAGRAESFREDIRSSNRMPGASPDGDAGLLAGDSEQVLLNRLLLEAAFPADTIARIDTRRLDLLFEDIRHLRGRGGVYSALCLSGGGIRSAAFSLGIVQGLAKCGLLDRFDFLSTVSGGGYLGSWLSTWVHRHPLGLPGVVNELASRAQPETGKLTSKLEPSPAPVGFLRNYSYFLNPRAGLLTVDTWTWVGIYLRNLSLNWLVIIPLLLLLVALPRLYAAALHSWRITHGNDVPMLSPGDPFPSLAWIATLAAVLTLVCVTVNRPSAVDPAPSTLEPAGSSGRRRRHFMAKFKQQPWLLSLGVLPLAVFAILMTVLVWGLPEAQMRLPLNQIWPFLSGGIALVQLPAALVFVGFEHIWLWGELIVLVGWLISVALFPARDWRKLSGELLIMLAAGLLTWAFVAGLANYTSVIGAHPREAFHLWSFSAYSVHLYAVLAVPTLILTVLGGMTMFIGAVSKAKWIEDEDREWWARFGSWILIVLLAWCALSAITIFGPPLLLEFPKSLAAVGGVSGLAALLLGQSSRTAAVAEKETAGQRRNGIEKLLGANSLAVIAAVFLAVFLAFLSLLSSAMLKALAEVLTVRPGQVETAFSSFVRDLFPGAGGELLQSCGSTAPPSSLASVFSDPQVHLDLICGTPWRLIALAMLVLAVVVGLASFLVNLNKFSLHAAYRIRIVRTFLGASRGERRQPNPFTGFDPLDDVQMHELLPGLLRETDILNLARLVEKLQRGLLDRTPSLGGHVVHLMCAPRHDRKPRRLRAHRDENRDRRKPPDRIPQRTEARDRGGVLEGRLRAYVPGKPVLKSLEQDVLEALNRVLQTARLDSDESFRQLIEQNTQSRAIAADAQRYFSQGNVILANRLLIQLAFPEEISKYRFPPPPPHKLLHVINLTLNLVRGNKLAWQERKAAPFVVTPMFAGSYYLGYRNVRDYGGKEGLSIGTAAAISGAAVSPNMGYSSSPLLAFLLTLFNVRLGWWLGNPGVAGDATYRRAEPKFSLHPLLSEALGLTDDQSPYAYLSDGGHFDNMGLFEMVLRRCQLIVCTDAGADPEYQFGDLGNAVRKIRIDLGIPIEFDAVPIHRWARPGDKTGRYCALGRIRYSYVDGPGCPDGVLICFKPVLCGNEAQDVLNYAAKSKVFPQEPTLDQFFGESQFESYRQLGQGAVQAVYGAEKFDDTDQVWGHWALKRVADYLGKPSADQTWLGDWLADVERRGKEAPVETTASE